MSLNQLSSRAIVGGFYEKLEQGPVPWFPQLAMRFDSNQESESYKWLGQSPQMREWVGGRQAKGLRANGFTVVNKTFEATLQILIDDMRRDKTGQIMVRVNDLAARAANHPVTLLSTLLVAGASGLCYDGQYFFDTDHVEGSSGSQSNKITVDISEIPVGTGFHGSTTAPSAEEMHAAILLGIQQLYSLKDDQGEPINELATNFVVVVPVSMWQVARSAVSTAKFSNGADNLILAGGLTVTVYANPRVTWTDRFAVFSTDGDTKAFIHQVEEDITTAVLDETSEFAFVNNMIQVGVKGIHNVAYGMWQKACMVILG